MGGNIQPERNNEHHRPPPHDLTKCDELAVNDDTHKKGDVVRTSSVSTLPASGVLVLLVLHRRLTLGSFPGPTPQNQPAARVSEA